MIRNYNKINIKMMFTSFLRNSNRFSTLKRSYSQEQTVDKKQIQHFKEQVNIWWDLNGKIRALHSFNEIRIPLIEGTLRKQGLLDIDYQNTETPLKNLSILDVGCGGGICCEALSLLGANVTGIDACDDLIQCAKLHANENHQIQTPITYISDVLENYTSKYRNKFDVVLNSECLEHVSQPEILLKSCTKVLKPGGSIFVTTWNKTLYSYLHMIIGSEYIFKLIPKGTHDWNKFIPLSQTLQFLQKYNCQIEEVKGISLNLYKNKWSIIPSTKLNYAIYATKRK